MTGTLQRRIQFSEAPSPSSAIVVGHPFQRVFVHPPPPPKGRRSIGWVSADNGACNRTFQSRVRRYRFIWMQEKIKSETGRSARGDACNPRYPEHPLTDVERIVAQY